MIECFLSGLIESSVEISHYDSKGHNVSTKLNDKCNLCHLDLVGELCPMPALKMKLAIQSLKPQSRLHVLFSDRSSLFEFLKLNIEVLEIDVRKCPYYIVVAQKEIQT